MMTPSRRKYGIAKRKDAFLTSFSRNCCKVRIGPCVKTKRINDGITCAKKLPRLKLFKIPIKCFQPTRIHQLMQDSHWIRVLLQGHLKATVDGEATLTRYCLLCFTCIYLKVVRSQVEVRPTYGSKEPEDWIRLHLIINKTPSPCTSVFLFSGGIEREQWVINENSGMTWVIALLHSP